MASTVAHAVSASWISVTAFHVEPEETPYIVAAFVAASILDLDHVLHVIRNRELYEREGYAGNLHLARSPLHELLGLLVVGTLTTILFFVDQKLATVVFAAFAIHIVQDWILGKSAPLIPFDRTLVQLFPLSLRQKAAVDVAVILTFGALWILYLTGHV